MSTVLEGGGDSPGSLIGWVSALHMSPLVGFRKVWQWGWLAELQTALAVEMQRTGTAKGDPWPQKELSGQEHRMNKGVKTKKIKDSRVGSGVS